MGTDTVFGSGRANRGTDTIFHPDMGTGTMSDIPIGNVQRATLNSRLSTG